MTDVGPVGDDEHGWVMVVSHGPVVRAFALPPHGTIGKELRARDLGADRAFRGHIYDYTSTVLSAVARPIRLGFVPASASWYRRVVPVAIFLQIVVILTNVLISIGLKTPFENPQIPLIMPDPRDWSAMIGMFIATAIVAPTTIQGVAPASMVAPLSSTPICLAWSASVTMTVQPGDVTLVPTGLVIEAPAGHFLGVFARSNLRDRSGRASHVRLDDGLGPAGPFQTLARLASTFLSITWLMSTMRVISGF